MKLRIYQVDAFTDVLFAGNPAAVCPLENWIPDELMQKIGLENNLSETAFCVGGEGSYELRWFTPGCEVDLCGHATLAAAWVLRNELDDHSQPLRFMTRSGELRVTSGQGRFTLDFPAQKALPCEENPLIEQALGAPVVELLAAEDYMAVMESETVVRNLQPDFSLLKKLDRRGVIVTAKGDRADFVSRWFGPNVGVDEDPVTGSAHTTLTPYWSLKLAKNELSAEQVSRRGGSLLCRYEGDRVLISGSAVKYMEGEILLDL